MLADCHFNTSFHRSTLFYFCSLTNFPCIHEQSENADCSTSSDDEFLHGYSIKAMNENNANSMSLENIVEGLNSTPTENDSQITSLALDANISNGASSATAMDAISTAATLQVEQINDSDGPPVPTSMSARFLQNMSL